MARRHVERTLYPTAEQVLRQALRLIALQDSPIGPADRAALTCQLGEVLDAAGRLDEALRMHQEAVTLLADIDERADLIAHAQNRLGHVLNCADRPTEAINAHEVAIATLRAAKRDDLLGPVLTDLGYTLWAIGRLDEPATPCTPAWDSSHTPVGKPAGTGPTQQLAWAWSHRTPATSTAPSPATDPRSLSSPTRAEPTTPTPRKHWTNSATRCACKAASPKPSTPTYAQLAYSNGSWARTTLG